jgi:N-methylhydantoinase B
VNEGVFEPLDIVCPIGLSSRRSRRHRRPNDWEAMMAATDVVWKALAEAFPSRLAAGHFCTANSTLLVQEGSGQPSIYLDVQGGGWGASADQDGQSALVCLSDGVARMTSAEIVEQRYGIGVERAAVAAKSSSSAARPRAKPAWSGTLTVTCGRHRFPPWGAAGVRDGTPNYVQVRHADGSSVKAGKLNAYPVVEGDLIEIVSGTGGDWGDPKLRSSATTPTLQTCMNNQPAARQRDVRVGPFHDSLS